MVVVVGATLILPFAATAPTPLLIETAVAFAVLQVRVALWPLEIDAGEAVNCAVGADGTVTVTVAALVFELEPLLAVSV